MIVRNEVDATLSNAGMRKVPGFNVPREMLPQEPAPTSRCCIDENENYSLFPKVQVLTLQEVTHNEQRFCDSSIICGLN